MLSNTNCKNKYSGICCHKFLNLWHRQVNIHWVVKKSTNSCDLITSSAQVNFIAWSRGSCRDDVTTSMWQRYTKKGNTNSFQEAAYAECFYVFYVVMETISDSSHSLRVSCRLHMTTRPGFEPQSRSVSIERFHDPPSSFHWVGWNFRAISYQRCLDVACWA